MNHKCNIAFLLLLFAGIPAAVCGENTDKELRKQLEEKLVNKPLVIRNFYAGDKLKYDSEGRLLSKEKPGKWTVDGCFVPDQVKLSKKEIVLGGKRHYWCFDPRLKKPIMIPYSYTTIAITRAPDCTAYSSIQKLVYGVFLAPGERLEDFVPAYWKNIIRANFSVKPVDFTIRTLADGRIVPKEAVKDPRRLTREWPAIPVDANPIRWAGTVILKAILDEEGTVSVQEILQPFGAGMDEIYVRNFETMKFSPAVMDGKPVKMFFIVEIATWQ